MAALTALALGALGASLYSAVSATTQKPKAVQPPALPAEPDTAGALRMAAEQARAREAQRRRALGPVSTRSGTLLTGPQGAQGSAPTERKTLLGL